MSTMEVVRNPVEGWDVRPEDETIAQSNHPSREDAIKAAELAVEVGEADEVEVHDDEYSQTAVDDVGFRNVALIFTAMVLAVTALVVVLSALGIAA